MFTFMRRASCALLVAVSGCASTPPAGVTDTESQALFGFNEPECPTASTSRSLSLFWWRGQRFVDHAVWSSDGAWVAAVETAYEEKKSWDPLNGTTDKRRTCHRVFVQKLDGTGKRYLGADVKGQAGNMFFMRPGSDADAYVLLQVYAGSAVSYDRVALDGKRSIIAKDGGRELNLVPSPDGRTIAQIKIQSCDAPPEGPFPDAKTEVRMLSDRGVLRGTPHSIVAPCYSVGFTFRPDNLLVVADGQHAYAFDTNGGAPTSTTLPRCVNPPTTSSWVDAQGRVLSFVDGKASSSDKNAELAFGCQ